MAVRNNAQITRLGGPVVEARVVQGEFSVSEAVRVGPKHLLAEVLLISEDTITVQVYETTAGLRTGDLVQGSGHPLSIPLGPGLLGGIFDGLLRPLEGTDSRYVQPGQIARSASTRFPFRPEITQDTEVRGGMVIGRVGFGGEAELPCLAPPEVQGIAVEVATEGDYTVDEPICRLETESGELTDVTLQHFWPVREPRPVRKRLAVEEPLFTGQRIIDAFFPIVRGGKAAMPGGFGTGKTILLQTLAKWCDADVIVYVGCGERGNEMTAVLDEFPELEDPRTGQRLMDRSVIIANTSNMPVAAREASIYTGITVAEYFRDMGLHAALFADSTSRWAEALREISGRLGELPGEAGYPAYLASRKAEFYERAAVVRTLTDEIGSVSVIGAVSPPGGDFSEPVTLHTQRVVSTFWPLDRDRARARFYPAIDPLRAYSGYTDELGAWWRQAGNSDWAAQRRRFLDLLQEQAHLERMARIVGKDALPPSQQLTLLCAELFNEGFLRQNAFSEVDRHASPKRQIAMLRVLERFVDCSEEALAAGAEFEAIAELPVLRVLRRMGEDISEAEVDARFPALLTEIERSLAALSEPDKQEAPA